jgi:hypothetical protein
VIGEAGKERCPAMRVLISLAGRSTQHRDELEGTGVEPEGKVPAERALKGAHLITGKSRIENEPTDPRAFDLRSLVV